MRKGRDEGCCSSPSIDTLLAACYNKCESEKARPFFAGATMGYEKTQRGGVHYILVVAAIAVLAGTGLSGEEFCAVLPFCLPCAAAADARP